VLPGRRSLGAGTLRGWKFDPDAKAAIEFAQRISVDYHLESLDAEETRNYIRHRLEVVGGDPDLFSAEACDAIYRYSGGVPRLINLLCDTALVYDMPSRRLASMLAWWMRWCRISEAAFCRSRWHLGADG
jgi:hypothetical protein